jgi:hypothetical protein
MPERHEQQEGKGLERFGFLRALYLADGEIQIVLGPDADVYQRGDVACVTEDPGDQQVLARVSCLVRWEDWLRKARVGTLRWLAEGAWTSLAAGKGRATTSVRSQLLRAGFIQPSELWGERTTDDCMRLGLWAVFELERRDR